MTGEVGEALKHQAKDPNCFTISPKIENMDSNTTDGTTSHASSVFGDIWKKVVKGGSSKHKYLPLGHNGEASGAGLEASESQNHTRRLLPNGESAGDVEENLDEESQLQQPPKQRGLLYRLVWGDPNKIFVKLIMVLLMIPLFAYLAAASA